MPSPSDYSNEGDFVSACIAQRQEEHPEEDQEQSAAVCYSMWRNKQAVGGVGGGVGDKPQVGSTSVGGVDVVRKTITSNDEGLNFILSDATPDRYGDVIMADGWVLENFSKNPIALFNHNTDFPIGKWENLRVENDALRGRLRLAPEGTSPRIDEIRKLVEAGILRAVSVGFQPIESKRRSATEFGELYLKHELLETSLVSVPANPNAVAIAKSLKVSDDTLKMVFAKHGNMNTKNKSVAVNGEHADTSKRKKHNMTPIGKRIEDAQQRLVKLKDQLTTHLENIDDAAPKDEDTATTETLTKSIEDQERALAALKNAEARLAANAAQEAAAEENDNNDGKSKNGMIIRSARPFAMPGKKVVPLDHLWRAMTVAVRHFGEGRTRPIIDVLRDEYGENETSNMTRVLIANMVTKAASAPADTTTSGWASQLVQTVIGELIDALMPVSVYPGLASRGGSFTFGRNGQITLPSRTGATAISGAFVAQGAAIPVKQGAFGSISLTPKKMGVITTLTREIVEHSTPAIEAIVRQAIIDDTAVAIDTVLLDATAASTTRPAGLKNGVSATGATSGGGIAALIGDIKGLIAALITGSNGNLRSPVWIINPGDVLAASLTQGATGSGDMPFRTELANGTLNTIPVLQTVTGTSDMMYLVDAADFITATGDSPRFDVSDQAVLHMEDTSPAALSAVGTPNTVAAPARSLWQTDTLAIRMILDINWAMRRTGMVAWTQTMTWN